MILIRRLFLPLIVPCVLASALLHAASAVAQTTGAGASSSGNRIEGDLKFLPIPYINYNRSIGLQGGALPLVMFNPVKRDSISPSSMAGMFGMYSGNKTWVFMVFCRIYLDKDNWRLAGAWGRGDYNFQFFLESPVDDWIPYSTDVDVAFAQLQRRLYRQLYGGISYVHLYFETRLDALPDRSTETALHGLGCDLSLDHRSSIYYPRSGFVSNMRLFTYPAAFGNETASDKLVFDYNHFAPSRHGLDVIATRFFAGAGLGDLAFDQQFIVGQRRDIRGYTQGAYRGDYMLALQGEYRWRIRERLGAVGFAGLATVFDGINEDDDGKPLPGLGVGVRFTADTETNMNIGLDWAVGVDDWGIYFGLGEAF